MQYIEYAAYFYTPAKAGHGWQGDYEQIIRIFENSCLKSNTIPIRLEPTKEELDKPLMLAREYAYRRFLTETMAKEIIFCDPDQTINKRIPFFLHHGEDQVACCAVPWRKKIGAMYNGVRILSRCSIPLLDNTIKRMEMMQHKYQQWDGDSVAWQDSVNEALINGTPIRSLNPDLWISSPYRGASNNSFMYHFKGNKGKDGLIEYAKQKGLL